MAANKHWTAAEITYLREKHGSMASEKIASTLHRSVPAIHKMAYRLGLESVANDGRGYTYSEVGRLVGMSRHTISDRWERDGLKFKNVGRLRKCSYENLCKFMKGHPDYYNARKREYYFFQEHKWFRDKWKQDRLMTDRNKPWKTGEVQTALRLYYQGLNFKQIAEKLGRSECSVKNKIWQHQTHKSYIVWTDDEKERLKNEVGQYDLDELAWMHDRSEMAIKSMCKKLGLAWEVV